MGNFWLDRKGEKGYFCVATVYSYEGDIPGIVSFDIEELKLDMPAYWMFLGLKPGRRYSIGIGAFHFLDPNYNPKAGDKIKIGLVLCDNGHGRSGWRYVAKRGENE